MKKMEVKIIGPEEKKSFNAATSHPVQSWEWGEFRQKSGLEVIRLAVFEKNKIKLGFTLSVHPLPILPFSIIYIPKCHLPNKEVVGALKKIGQEHKAIFIKIEPNVTKTKLAEKELSKLGFRKSKDFFAPHTFQIDLRKSEEELLAAMKSKTRYNIKIADKHKIEIIENNSSEAFAHYLKLTEETTKRQHFYTHTPRYHQLMWEALNPPGIARLLLAKYKNRILTTWVLFVYNNVLYYPYGASTRDHQEKMPAYRLMWEAIKLGRKMGLTTFDLWGCLGENPNPQDPWFGFHRFKEGFGGQLVEFCGSWDLVLNPRLYLLYNLANSLRWQFLRLKAGFRG